MTFEHGIALWSSEEWLGRALAWVDAAGVVRTGEAERKTLRPWATVLRVPATDGAVWLKATGPEVAFEAGLYELLERVAPDRVLSPLAVDVEQGWLLLPDGGPTFGDRLEGAELLDAMEGALRAYGRLQRELAPHVDEMLALGVSDMRPAALPARFDEAVAAVRGYGADEEQLARVVAMRPTVVAWCERLTASPVLASLDHNDLHPWNFLGDARAPRFYDWGDGVLAHPFASMLALGFVRMEEGDRRRLRDAYLEAFADLAPHAALVEDLELACRAGKIARTLTWDRAIRSARGADEVDEEWLDGPGTSLLSLLEDSWLGRA